MRMLITGGNGQLGNELRRCLEAMEAEIGPVPAEYAGAQVDYTDYDVLDISDAHAVHAWFAEHGPYDAIVVTAAAPALVQALLEQLAVGGMLVAPVGGASAQSLLQLVRHADGSIEERTLAPVVFVPLLAGTLD